MIKNMTLTTCEEGQFTCDSGDCISIESRCDNAKDCLDSSDEVISYLNMSKLLYRSNS